jgi:hypothetical protein
MPYICLGDLGLVLIPSDKKEYKWCISEPGFDVSIPYMSIDRYLLF